MCCYNGYITDELVSKGLCFYIYSTGRHALKDKDFNVIAGGSSSDMYYAASLVGSIVEKYPSIKIKSCG